MSATYPLLRGERVALRARAFSDYMAEARRRAAGHGRSLKCRGETADLPRHVDDPGGCANDGGSCLCPCHDRPAL